MVNHHVVRARPPSRIPRPPRAAAAPLSIAPEPARTAPPELPSPAPGRRTRVPALPLAPDAALLAFRKLVAGWNMREDCAWRMLTGKPSPSRALTEDQAWRVALLVEIDAAIGGFHPDTGAWMTDPNPGPLLMGRSPADFLTRMGTPGYVSLARQARRWAEM